MNSLKNIFVSFLAAGALVAAVASAGCVAESFDGCPPEVDCRLTFSYVSDTREGNSIGDYVRAIGFYVFDAGSGVLTRIIEVGETDIARGWVDIADMADGEYTFVAWGSSHRDAARSFSASHMADAGEHVHSAAQIGRTTLNDFYMMLGYNALPAGGEAEIVPAVDDFDDLFWATAIEIKVVDRGNRIIPFVFIRNTNILKITVTGLEHLPAPATRATGATRAVDAPLSIFATGSNGRYQWDNTIDPWARKVLYEQPFHTLTDTGMWVDIKTMRLDVERHVDDDPMLLHLRDAAGNPIIAPTDIVKEIMKSRSQTGQPLYPNQEAIDREYEFPILIEIAPDPDPDPGEGTHGITVTITVGDWGTVIVKPEV